jgi:cell division protein FtsB
MHHVTATPEKIEALISQLQEENNFLKQENAALKEEIKALKDNSPQRRADLLQPGLITD